MIGKGLIVQCGHCGARYRIDERYRGRRGRCRRCRHVFRMTPKVNLDDTVMDWLEQDEDDDRLREGGSPTAA